MSHGTADDPPASEQPVPIPSEVAVKDVLARFAALTPNQRFMALGALFRPGMVRALAWAAAEGTFDEPNWEQILQDRLQEMLPAAGWAAFEDACRAAVQNEEAPEWDAPAPSGAGGATTFIYALIEPRPEHPNFERVRYVGKSDKPETRLQHHLKWDKNNRHKSSWLAQLSSAGLKPRLVILEECLFDDWQAREHYWEQHLRATGEPLTNLAEGGRGRIYYTTTEAYREKCRQVQAALQGDPERRAKQSAAARKTWADPEFKARMSAKQRGKKRSEEICEKFREARQQKLEEWEETGPPASGCVKVWEGFIDPEGNPVAPIFSLARWCKERGLQYPGMRMVYLGEVASCRGWTNNRPEAITKRSSMGLPPGHTPEARRGQPRTEATRQKQRESMLGHKHTEETRERMQLASERRSRLWEGFVSPLGEEIPAFRNLRKFSREHGQDECGLHGVYHGEQRHHRGWTSTRPEALARCAEREAATREARARAGENRRGWKPSPETIEKMRQAQLGRPSPMAGRKHTPEAREKMREAIVKRCALIWEGFRRPDGTPVEPFENLAAFCRNHGLNHGAMVQVYHGRCRQHKGWTRPLDAGAAPPHHEHGGTP